MLLTTKLFAPRRQLQLISRRRLHALLDGGLQGKVVLVSAPPGFGKTTLVVDWLEGLRSAAAERRTDGQPCKRTATWLALDEQDNDPVRFLTYLVAALQIISPLLGRGLQNLLGGPQPLPLNNALTMLLNDLAGFEQPFVLVLDDYHVIHQPSIHQALTFLVEHLPPVMHLVITSRTDPPLPLARWRMKRELTEVRERDLRFTHEETASFLRQTLQIELTSADLQALEQRTEGWITGLQLVALSMDGRPDLPQFVAAFTGSHAYIVDYLSEEVLQRQTPAMQEFLLRTAILNRLSAPLCDWLIQEATDGGKAQSILEQLERNRLFVVPLDSERKWYRYHHLFADVLRARLRQNDPGLVAQLHRRASCWFANQGLKAEA
ncbi:MAG TPA: AAA family ATPase, partial [Caldilineaceae bacterium]|nr:AAA family ATPase [Caldilineaceae bacterium]